VDDPDGVDDRADAKYLMSVGGDWWESMTAVWDNWTTNYDMGIGRFRFITPDWKGYNMISLPEEDIRKNPPPFAGNTAVDDSPATLVDGFELRQNYPNPFNPTTTIEYSIPELTPVKLQVFDMTGRTITTLVNGMRPAGTHVVQFEASDLASGLLFYKLSAGDRHAMQKMMLIR
jgi:hypothetical protein